MKAKHLFVIFIYGFCIYGLTFAFTVTSLESYESSMLLYQDVVDVDTSVFDDPETYEGVVENATVWSILWHISPIRGVIESFLRLFNAIGVGVTLLIGFLTFSIASPEGMIIPDFMRIIFFIMVLPVWLAVMSMLIPLGVKILHMIGNWIPST